MITFHKNNFFISSNQPLFVKKMPQVRFLILDFALRNSPKVKDTNIWSINLRQKYYLEEYYREKF